MKRELRWLAIALSMLALGVLCARPYARLASPFYALAARMIAHGRPWTISSVEVARGNSSPGAILRMSGTVSERKNDAVPGARLVSKLQVAPVIFWTLLVAWPAASVRRLALIGIAVPIFVGLEVATTVCQLIGPFAYASAVLAGDADPVTWWERWSRFLEAGGRVGLAFVAALATIGIAQWISRLRAHQVAALTARSRLPRATSPREFS